MSELAIQQGIQGVIQAMSEFADADVVINDWSILDQANLNAPYVLITDADNFDSTQDAETPETSWEEVVTLIENFVDWPTTLNNLRTRRQAIIDTFNAVGTARSAGGLEATDITNIRAGGPISAKYDSYLTDEQLPEALPQYLLQPLVFTCKEY